MGESRSYGRIQILLMLHVVDTLGFGEVASCIGLACNSPDGASRTIKLARTVRTAMMTASRYRTDAQLMDDVFRLVLNVKNLASF